LKANPYNIPYYADKEGVITKTELIGLAGSTSTISTQIDQVEVLTSGLELRLEGNSLHYKVSDFGDYEVRIHAHIPMFAGSDTVMTSIIHYGPDNMARDACEVYIQNDRLMRSNIRGEKAICELENSETLLAVDGAYAYVASANTLTRINLTTGQTVATTDCSVESFCVKANMVIVRGKKDITLWHKTDLTPVKTFDLITPIINIENLTTATIESEYCIDVNSIGMQDRIAVAAIPNNEAPKFKLADSPQSVTVKENSELTTNISYSRNTKLSDKEKVSNVKLYIRNLQEVKDLIAYKSGSYDKMGTNFRFVAGCQRAVEQDTIIYIALEAIDEWGASTIATQIKININNTDVSTNIEAIGQCGDEAVVTTRKLLFNGNIYILYEGIYYDILGNKTADIQ
jgi:hypothetical protein